MISTRLEQIIAAGLLLLVAFAALAHGAVEPWAKVVFQLSIVLLLTLWVTKCLVDQRITVVIPITFWPIAAFLVCGLIQSLQVARSDGTMSGLSFDPEATRHAVTTLALLLASHLIAVNFFSSGTRQQTFVRVLVGFGFLVALFSLLQFFTGESIFFWAKPAFASDHWLNGPFVNHNHFAGYMELIIPVPIALILTGAAGPSRVFYGFAAAVMTVAAVLSASRGGIISVTFGLLFLSVCAYAFARQANRVPQRAGGVAAVERRIVSPTLIRNAITLVAIMGAIAAGLFWIGVDPVVQRLPGNDLIGAAGEVQTFEDSRGWIWKNSLNIFRANPVLGTGLGTFETAFPRYSEGFPADPVGKLQVWKQAHNDYIQVLTDTGLIGAGIALWFIGTVAVVIRRSLSQNDPFAAGLAIGCSAALISVAIHSVFDFNLQLPSTSLLFLISAGVVVDLASTKGRR